MDNAMLSNPNAGFSRRLAAMFYDGFLIVALYLIVGIIITGVLETYVGVTMPTGWPATALLCAISGVFHIYFWVKGGQTLGMQVWRLKLIDDTGHTPDTATCLMRFVVSLLSMFALFLGYFYMLINKERLALHDMASDTRVVYTGTKPLRVEMSASTPEQDDTDDKAQQDR